MSEHELPADQLPAARILGDEEPIVVQPNDPDVQLVEEGDDQ